MAEPRRRFGFCLAGLWFTWPSTRIVRPKQGLPAKYLSDPLESFSKGRPVGPILIIGIGFLLLLHNFDWFPWWRVQQFWPLLLIAVGVLMFRNRLGGRS